MTMTNGQQAMAANLVPIIDAGLGPIPTADEREDARAAWRLIKKILTGSHTAASHARRGRPAKATTPSEGG